MLKEDIIAPIYLSGFKDYHSQLDKSFNEAIKLACRLVPMRDTLRDRLSEWREITLFVDFTEAQPDNCIKAYLVIGKRRIIRFINFIIDWAALFPVSDHWRDENRGGITYDTIIELKQNRKRVYLKFLKYRETSVDHPMFDIKLSQKDFEDNTFNACDDIGKPYYEFPDIQCLKQVDIPNEFLERQYSLVGKQFYAPYTTGNTYHCVLFAELNNQYDDNAIKVLRWFPITRQEWDDNVLLENIDSSDIFYELGHISRQENQELHNFMVSNNTRLLFAKAKEDKISIIGGVKIFFENDYNYPVSLFKIPVE